MNTKIGKIIALSCAVCIVSLAVVVIAAEVSLRIFKYGIDTDPFVKVKMGAAEYYKDNIFFVNKYYPGAKNKIKSDERNLFSVKKDKSVLRGFVIGGSGASGFPYSANQGFGAFTGEALFRSGKYGKVEMVNLGFDGLNSFYVKDVAEKIMKYNPDFVIIYSGHDEYCNVMEYKNQGFAAAAKEFKLGQLFSNLIMKKGVALSGPRRMELLPEDEVRIQNRFLKNITDTAALFDKKHIPVVIVEPAVNLYDLPPFAGENDKAAAEFIASYKEALDTKDTLKIAGCYELSEKVELYRKNAQVQYLNGRAGMLLGGIFAAQSGLHLNNARDLDLIPLRGKSALFGKLTNYYAEKHNEFKNVRLLPLLQSIQDMDSVTLAGNKLFTDHIHFNVEGNRLMAYYLVSLLSEVFALDNAKTTGIFDLNVANFNDIFTISDVDGFNAFMNTYAIINSAPFTESLLEYSIAPVIDMENQIVADPVLYNRVKFLSGKELYSSVGEYYVQNDDLPNSFKTALSYSRNYPGYGGSHFLLAKAYKLKNTAQSAAAEVKSAYYLSGGDKTVMDYAKMLLTEGEMSTLEKSGERKK